MLQNILPRVLKLATVISFLFIMVPGEKVSVYVWMMPLMMLYDLGKGEYFVLLIGLPVMASHIYLMYSAIRNKPTWKDGLISLISTAILTAFAILFLTAVKKYGGQQEKILLITFFVFALANMVLDIVVLITHKDET
jgi:hypothetical protein